MLIAILWGGLWPSRIGSATDGTLAPQSIIARVRVHADDFIQHSTRYKFYATVLREDLDQAGAVKERYEETERVFHIRGRRFVRRLTVNGKPLSGDALAREESREREFRQRTASERAQADERDLSGTPDRRWVHLTDLLDRYEYKLLRTERLNGRLTHVLSYRPRPKLPVRERRDHVFNKLAGTVWVDAQESRIVKADGHLIDNIRIGVIALNLKNLQIHYEQRPVEPGVWLPSRIALQLAGSIFFVKKLNRRASIEFYNFARADRE